MSWKIFAEWVRIYSPKLKNYVKDNTSLLSLKIYEFLYLLVNTHPKSEIVKKY